MNGSARLVICCAIVVCSGRSALAQSTLQPAAPPLVTAETQQWYQNGEPLMYAGNVYYPAGAQVHFNGNEMVRTGFYQGVPLYSEDDHRAVQHRVRAGAGRRHAAVRAASRRGYCGAVG